mmetsp:Transcript_29871/g.21621  ORF Transcript_29871/g.21621 Transcript_29871/m.21621 type:complete len:191 (+) Transcript_29871:706-1278(+)
MLACSTTCHWLYSKSKRCCGFVSRLDYAGIAIMIMGSCYPFICYKFACGSMIFYRRMFLSGITLISLACFVACMTPSFMKAKNKGLRGIMFITLGLLTLVIFAFLYIMDDTTEALPAKVGPYALGGAIYIFGAILYVTDVPERFWPGKFDIWGCGHQVFHICVVIGAMIHYVESWRVYKERLEFVCPIES